MSKRIFTKEQLQELLENENIASCTERSITYSKEFKIHAIKLYEEGLTSSEIFRQAGFNLDVVGRNQPKECLRRWRELVRKKDVRGLSEARGKNGKDGRPRTKDLTDTDKIKWLEAKVAYLKAENDFLAKLRAKRME